MFRFVTEIERQDKENRSYSMGDLYEACLNFRDISTKQLRLLKCVLLRVFFLNSKI
jgi:hypothetical protein